MNIITTIGALISIISGSFILLKIINEDSISNEAKIDEEMRKLLKENNYVELKDYKNNRR